MRAWLGRLSLRYKLTLAALGVEALMLAFLSMILSAIVGVVTGIISATRQYSFFDNISTVFALTGISIPAFWGGMMLIIIFSVSLGWLPSSGFERPLQWILPTCGRSG